MNTCLKLVSTAILIFSLGGLALGQDPEKGLHELVATERAFAAETVKLGFRDGFVKFFADDGIGFGPHPQRTREVLLKSPPPVGPRKVIFNWAPIFGDISLAGDLGYTTGPVLFTDLAENPRPPWHGIYFSVWQKQADGSWKVAIDLGVDTPNAVAPIDSEFTAAESVKRGTAKIPMGDDYRKLDQTLWESIANAGVVGAYDSRLDKQFRIHRKGVMPITDRKHLAATIVQTSFEFIDGKIASSGDLAFTYGKYATVNAPGGDDTGYYVHVWRRGARLNWKLVVDFQNPLPKTTN